MRVPFWSCAGAFALESRRVGPFWRRLCRPAVGSSLAIITTTSVMGLAAPLLGGRGIGLGVTAIMTAAGVGGALAGAALAGRVPQRRLGRGFAGLVAAVASYLLVSAAVLGGPPGS